MLSLDKVKFNTELGKILRARRKLLGLSQKHVADKIGVSHQQYQKYESGQTTISSYMLRQIFDVLELNDRPKKSLQK